MVNKEKYDLVVVGSGPGGYVAAVRAAQLDLKVACIEKEPRLGGVCLNIGCIPSKALLDSSEYYHLAKEQFAVHGIKTGRISLDLPTMMARKEKVVQDLTANVKRLLESHKIEIIHGTAKLAGSDRVEVAQDPPGAKKRKLSSLQAKAIILATGSMVGFENQVHEPQSTIWTPPKSRSGQVRNASITMQRLPCASSSTLLGFTSRCTIGGLLLWARQRPLITCFIRSTDVLTGTN